ncbi:ABC transporter permease [Brenneria corticis]|uniref:Peptide ABC transporter permease n=1 Tax=Brenneria corticis TaxID=2173106 RepID=A0A2U1TUH3_9GAMM|nr:ABC transporter permease [Brenneria sp. CFCC 11842]PWC13044.1 peptide ABC transporter permease [Brenneria sp. CFCC 11842]
MNRLPVGAWVGGTILLLLLAVAVAGPWLLTYDAFEQDLGNRLAPPLWHEKSVPGHPLGTDQLGRDYLARLVYGARISLLIGFCVTLMSGFIGITLGLIAGYAGGVWDNVIGFLITTRLSMPVVLVALALVSVTGPSLSMVVLVLGLLLWDHFAVVVRSATQQIRRADYVQAARAMGCSLPYLLLREILPNLRGPLLVISTVEMAHAVLVEATLSFLGLGVPAPLPSWGLMLAEAKSFMFFSPWLIALPGAALGILVLAINMVGDSARSAGGAR